MPVAHVAGAWGVQGWLRVRGYATDGGALETVDHWWLRDAHEAMRVVTVEAIKPHSGDWVVRLAEVPDRSAAELLKGSQVLISRADFPVPDKEEFYWVDLIGCEVFDRQGAKVGRVDGVMDNGAHAILEVRTGEREGRPVMELIPFVQAYVGEVDVTAKRIVVDWSSPV
ncbi:MAG TPA: ribosome maturation factor RimM [Burkholderiaceae bacterium]|nr:ribosome maturation factor RimM [Burkholderiaceae bacterium]